MDIKDLIIIAGSVFFVLIVAHGLWVARRNRQNEIRMDIKVSDTQDDSPSVLSPELPNGGARVISQALQEESVETASDASASNGAEEAQEALLSVPGDQKQTPIDRDSTPPRTDDLFETEGAPLISENRVAENKRSKKSTSERQAKGARESVRSAKNDTTQKEPTPDDSRRQNPQMEELLILGVMAKPDAPFGGDDLVAALRGQGLKFGDMGIFHRTQGDSGERLFSVANAVEPGTFDLSDLTALQTPGLTFFMQLPVPGDALETLDDMILSARTVAAALGGDVKDDTMSALTGQTVEHLKQRIADFARKQLTASSDG